MPGRGASLGDVAALELVAVFVAVVPAGAGGREQPASAASATASAAAIPGLLLNMCMSSYRPRANFSGCSALAPLTINIAGTSD